jgi:nuclear pore complex protein Nup205
MQAWRHALDMVLARAAHLFRPDMHGVVVFDCLAALLPRLSGPSPEADPALGDLVAGAVLGLLTSLRLHRASTSSAAAALETDGPDELPIDRLVTTLRALLAALVRPGTSILARGNLYTALINYLQLVRSDPSAEGDGAALDNMTDDAGSVSFIDGDFDDAASLGGSVSARLGTSSVAETRTRALVASHLDRLVPILARDALDAIDIWRTVVYTLCDKLSALETKPSRSSGSSGPNARALEILSRQGFLKTFVAGLRDMDMALQEVLRPDPSSLNALYVYGAQLAFFSRLAQSRAGAERLIEARIFEVLAQADHLSARPEQDQHFVDLDSFLPAAMERYDALLTPALQLCVATLSSTSQRHARALAPASAKANGAFSSSSSAPRQALAFIEAHRTTLLTVLKVPTADTTSLAAISQAQLLVAMFVFILPALDDDALAPGSPLAGFHSAVLALAASFLHVSAWRERVLPQTEAEREDATRIFLAPGQQGAMEEDSVFDTSARVVVGRLTASLLAYLELASETRGRPDTTREAGAMRLRVRPCLTAALQAQGWRGGQDRYDDETSRFGAGGAHLRSAGSSVPGLGSCLAALEEQVTGLDRDLQGIDSSSAMLEQPDAVTLQEWDEVSFARSLRRRIMLTSPLRRSSETCSAARSSSSALDRRSAAPWRFASSSSGASSCARPHWPSLVSAKRRWTAVKLSTDSSLYRRRRAAPRAALPAL